MDPSDLNLNITFESKLVVSDLDPQPLDGHYTSRLLRYSTNMSEISRILTAIRDDHDQDAAEFELYRSRQVPEEQLVEQLDFVEEEETESDDHPIDGPFALWQSCLVLLIMFLTWGANAGFGVFLNYYLTTDAFPGATQYDFALMGGIIVFLAQFIAPLSALAVRVFGQRVILAIGVILQTLAYFLAAECKQLWQIFLCQGVLVGLLFAMLFIPATFALPTWFNKRRSTAMGIAYAGSGLGGLVFSLSLNRIIEETGDQRWALRMMGFVTLATTLVCLAFLRVRLVKRTPWRERFNWTFVASNFKVIFDVSVFDNYPSVIVGLWYGVTILGYMIVLYSLLSYATSIGLTHTQGSNVLAILNAAQVVGRPLVGNVGDYFGRTNASTVFCLMVAILIYAFWINTTTYGALIALAVLLGLLVGVGSTMTQPLAADVLDKLDRSHRLPAVWSGLNIIVAVSTLPAEVIALKLRRPDAVKQYEHTQIFTGSCYIFGMFILLVNREWLVRRTFETRREHAQEMLSVSEMYPEGVAKKEETELAVNSKVDENNSYESHELLEARVARYNRLLARRPAYYFIRMFYPIRV